MTASNASRSLLRPTLLATLLALGCAHGPAPRPPALTLPPAVMPPAPESDRAWFQGRRIALDPGHGGVFYGAVGASGLRESDLNLDIARLLAGRLRQAGADVWLSRDSDTDFVGRDSSRLRDDLEWRVEHSNAFNPDVFLSIHHNADARRDTSRNVVETYFRMTDPGASQDVAGHVTPWLAQAQGIQKTELIPGNFYVIRRSTAGAALLGEASYLSNPENEAQLITPGRRVKEADAYYHALADYFRAGVPKLNAVTPPDTVLSTPPQAITLEVADGPGGRQLDPNSLLATLDDQPVLDLVEERVASATTDSTDTTRFTPGLLRVNLPVPPGLANAPHEWALQARNLNGNSLPGAHGAFRLASPATQLSVRTVPPSVRHLGARGAELFEIVVQAKDARGIPVNGSRGELRLSNGWFQLPNGDFSRDSVAFTLHDGEFHALVRLAAKSAHDIDVSATVGGLRAMYVDPDEPQTGRWVLLQAKTVVGASVVALPGATVLWNGGVIGRTDEAGFIGVRMPESSSRVDSVTVAMPGYLRRAYSVNSILEEYSVDLGAGLLIRGNWPYLVFDQAVLPSMPDGDLLRGVRIALDPAPPAGPSEPGMGLAGPDIDYRLARTLQGFLEAVGAEVLVTRGSEEAPSVISRLKEIEAFRAQRVLMISHQGGPSFNFNPGSGGAEQWCRAQSDVWEQLVGGRKPFVGDEARYLLRHSSGSAMLAQLGSPPDPTAPPEELGAHLRLEALALYEGLLASLAAPGQPLSQMHFVFGHAWAHSLLRLDGNLLFTLDREGRATLPVVAPGTHRVDAELEGEGTWALVDVPAGRSKKVGDGDLRGGRDRAAPASGLPEAALHQRYPEELKPVFQPAREPGDNLHAR